jgi:peptide methionine sulfoxide reductase MsrA
MKKIILVLTLLYSAVQAQNLKTLSNDHTEKITLGGGCYWCIEAVFQMLNGVVKVESGFSGGQVKNPSYKDVCAGTTGHAEVVQITFDNTKTSIEEILKVFFTVHDPTTLNRQGADEGTQYRSAIFYHNQNQYKAEAYHQNYYNENKNAPYCRMVIQPKIEKFEKVFKNKIKK